MMLEINSFLPMASPSIKGQTPITASRLFLIRSASLSNLNKENKCLALLLAKTSTEAQPPYADIVPDTKWLDS